ncbi:MAG TPA: two-component regulator propeller domain-containing protein [Candidatus Paceibacterota bacterium]|nr:two-component regulator propeller domain-containing protein [Verrucomicrobiota bacterium]HRY46940.1 two-component regulator propeller domain-containing protein [Candidatus Paceibacterota bacterium]
MPTKHIWFWWVTAAGILSGAGQAEDLIHLRTARTAEHLISYWTSEHGLPQNTVTCLAQSRDGYLWLGTRYGLARFDGLQLKAYVQELGALDLGCLDIQGVVEDSLGVLWLRTAAGLVTYRQGRFTRQPVDQLPFSGPIMDIGASRAGGVWVARREGLFHLIGSQVTRTYGIKTDLGLDAGSEGWWLCAVREDRRGLLWIALTDERDVEWRRLDLVTRRVETLTDVVPEASPRAWDLLEDRHGRLWVAQSYALICADQGHVRRFDATQAWGSARVLQMVEDQRGEVWVISEGATQVHRFSDGIPLSYGAADGLSAQDDFRCLFADREGNVWVGTGSRGVNRIQPRQLLARLEGSRTMMDEVYSVSPGPDGAVWMATSYGLVMARDGAFRVIPSTIDQPDEGWVLKTRPVLAGRGGEIWMGLDGLGLGMLKGSQFERAATPNLRTEGVKRQVNSLLETRSGDLWAGTSVGLLQRRGSEFRLWTTQDGLADNRVFGLAEGADGSLWIGTENAGIIQFQEGRFSRITPDNGLLHHRAWPLLAEPDGTLWVGTPIGLNRIRGSEVRGVTMQDGLYDSLAYCLIEDRRGDYWTFGNRGIWRVRKADLHAAADGRGGGLSCVSYGENDGMISVEGNGDQQPNAALLPNGELWFPTTRGVVIVDPGKLQDNQVPPGVVIEEVRIDEEIVVRDSGRVGADKAVTGTESDRLHPLRLGPGRARVVEIRFTATTFIEPEKARFRYRLVGHDVDWRHGGRERLVFYTNLSPGHYAFEVMACNQHGYWSVAPAVFAFSLAPRFYQSTAFRWGCSAAIAGALATWHLWRRRRRRERQRQRHQELLLDERSRIAKDLHDELGASMTGIALQMEVCTNQSSPEALPKQIRELAGALRASAGRMRELVWTINPGCDTLECLCARLGQYAEQYLRTAGLRCRLDLPMEAPDFEVPAEARHQLLMIVKEALTNIVKHAQATEGLLQLQWDDSCLRLTVADNGCGLPKEGHFWMIENARTSEASHPRENNSIRGGGLDNMEQRAKSLGGTLRLMARPGGGTQVILEFPLTKLNPFNVPKHHA